MIPHTIYNGKTLRYEEYWEHAMERLGAVEVWQGVFELKEPDNGVRIESQQQFSEFLIQSGIDQRFFDATCGG